MKKVLISAVAIVGLSAGMASAMMGGGGMGGGIGSAAGGIGSAIGGMMGGGSYGGGAMGNDTGNGYHGYGNDHMYPGDGSWNNRRSPDYGNWGRQDGRNYGAQAEFLDETADLRRQLSIKQFEYEEARRNPGSRVDDLIDLERELRNLRYQIDNIAGRMGIRR